MFVMIEEKFWVPFTQETGLEELRDDCRKREWQAPDSFEKMRAFVKSKSLAEWENWLSDKEYSITKILTKDEAIPAIVNNKPEMLNYVTFPNVGRVLQTNVPHNISNLQTHIESFNEAALLGENTEEVLMSLGIDRSAIEKMAQEKVIFLGAPVDYDYQDNNPTAP